VADAVRVGLDRLVLDALSSEALEERVEPNDGEGNPASARPRRVRLDEEPGTLVDLPENLLPDASVWGRPKNRVYQSMLASRSDTGTPAKRWVIALISFLGRGEQRARLRAGLAPPHELVRVQRHPDGGDERQRGKSRDHRREREHE
jgi:hypothetical protein